MSLARCQSSRSDRNCCTVRAFGASGHGTATQHRFLLLPQSPEAKPLPAEFCWTGLLTLSVGQRHPAFSAPAFCRKTAERGQEALTGDAGEKREVEKGSLNTSEQPCKRLKGSYSNSFPTNPIQTPGTVVHATWTVPVQLARAPARCTRQSGKRGPEQCGTPLPAPTLQPLPSLRQA